MGGAVGGGVGSSTDPSSAVYVVTAQLTLLDMAWRYFVEAAFCKGVAVGLGVRASSITILGLSSGSGLHDIEVRFSISCSSAAAALDTSELLGRASTSEAFVGYLAAAGLPATSISGLKVQAPKTSQDVTEKLGGAAVGNFAAPASTLLVPAGQDTDDGGGGFSIRVSCRLHNNASRFSIPVFNRSGRSVRQAI